MGSSDNSGSCFKFVWYGKMKLQQFLFIDRKVFLCQNEALDIDICECEEMLHYFFNFCRA